ncbi:MAG: hypothetical protein JNL74_12195 [Fibrobacteres bacterium]|nr:hypothetical protein [Fibrobacterota bacterium]
MRLLSNAIVLIAFALSAGVELADPKFDAELSFGMELTLNQEFDKADSVSAAIIKRAPDNPAGYFLRATVRSAKYYDSNDTSQISVIQTMCSKVAELTEKRNSPEAYLYKGAALAYSSILHAKEDRWLAGALAGKKSSDVFKKVITDKVKSSDASGMLGGYYYWTSVFIHRFSWLPFFADRRQEGISLLKKSIPDSRYLKFALINSLLWIYYDNFQYDKALALCNEVLKKYPDHRIFRQAKMHILFKMNRLKESSEMAHELIKDWSGKEIVPINLLNVRIKLAITYYSMGKRTVAAPMATELIKYKKDPYIRMRLSKEFGYLEDAVRKNRQEK